MDTENAGCYRRKDALPTWPPYRKDALPTRPPVAPDPYGPKNGMRADEKAMFGTEGGFMD